MRGFVWFIYLSFLDKVAQLYKYKESGEGSEIKKMLQPANEDLTRAESTEKEAGQALGRVLYLWISRYKLMWIEVRQQQRIQQQVIITIEIIISILSRKCKWSDTAQKSNEKLLTSRRGASIIIYSAESWDIRKTIMA